MIKLFQYTYTFKDGSKSVTFVNPAYVEAVTTCSNNIFNLHLESGKKFSMNAKDFFEFCRFSKIEVSQPWVKQLSTQMDGE